MKWGKVRGELEGCASAEGGRLGVARCSAACGRAGAACCETKEEQALCCASLPNCAGPALDAVPPKKRASFGRGSHNVSQVCPILAPSPPWTRQVGLLVSDSAEISWLRRCVGRRGDQASAGGCTAGAAPTAPPAGAEDKPAATMVLRMRHFIDSHKAANAAAILLLIAAYGAWDLPAVSLARAPPGACVHTWFFRLPCGARPRAHLHSLPCAAWIHS